MSEEKQKEIKTLKGWEESGKNWDDFCKPGELVDEDIYWYFLNILPPRNMGAGYLQVGEPYDSRLNPKTGKYMATYSTFVKVGIRYGNIAEIVSQEKALILKARTRDDCWLLHP